MARIPKSIAGFLLSLLILAPVLGADHTVLFSEDFEKPLGERWKQVTFSEPTDYRVVQENSNACLKASANAPSSAFATKLEVQPVAGTMIH